MPECGSNNLSSSSAACTNETEECEFDSNTTTDSIVVPTVCFLDHHHCAERSSLARKSKVKTDPAPVGAKKDNDTRQRQHYYTDSSPTMIAILSISLLDGLKCAQRSSLARKRNVKTNLDPVEARNGQ